MQTINQCWHQPPVQARAPASDPNPASQFDVTAAWNRICTGAVLYRGSATPFPVYLPFNRFEALNGGGNAAVFELTVAERQLQAWVVPDRLSGEPRVVHAKGGIDKATDVTFVDHFRKSSTAAVLPSAVPTHQGGTAMNLNPQQQQALLQALLQSTSSHAQRAPSPVIPARVHSSADWARAHRSQVTVWVPEIGRPMPMAYVREGQLYNGRKALVFELRLHRVYRCMVAPSDRNGEPIVVACDKPDERSQFKVVG